jgi:AraC-like DNA-binding protein/mannose-6-phosphate isomerase-like protein (cupin superfamily)
MKLYERGVMPESNIYFHIPKEQNRIIFLTPNSCGYYFCDSSYKANREKYSAHFLQNDARSNIPGHHGSYLCLFVKNGKGYVYQNDHKVILKENDAFLLDCYRPHVYGAFAGSKMEILWVHFDGPMIRSCFKYIAKNTNCSVLKDLSPNRAQTIYNNLFSIYKMFDQKEGIDDILNNKYLVIVITEFLQGNLHAYDTKSYSWDDLLRYISENVQKPIKIKDLAEIMAMSPYHFIRKFKKEIGYTPHHYILFAKISTANHLLRSSSLSLKEIAFACGFSSEGSFCNAFKNIIGEWPMSYKSKIN